VGPLHYMQPSVGAGNSSTCHEYSIGALVIAGTMSTGENQKVVERGITGRSAMQAAFSVNSGLKRVISCRSSLTSFADPKGRLGIMTIAKQIIQPKIASGIIIARVRSITERFRSSS
jgi:hypothetical protein